MYDNFWRESKASFAISIETVNTQLGNVLRASEIGEKFRILFGFLLAKKRTNRGRVFVPPRKSRAEITNSGRQRLIYWARFTNKWTFRLSSSTSIRYLTRRR